MSFQGKLLPWNYLKWAASNIPSLSYKCPKPEGDPLVCVKWSEHDRVIQDYTGATVREGREQGEHLIRSLDITQVQ